MGIQKGIQNRIQKGIQKGPKGEPKGDPKGDLRKYFYDNVVAILVTKTYYYFKLQTFKH